MEPDIQEPSPARPSNRGFWLVAGSIGVASIVLVVAIVANRSLRDDVAHAQFSLRRAQEAAERIRAETGALAAADAGGLAAAVPALEVRGPDDASDDPGAVSVLVGPRGWSAAVAARPGACFYLRIDPTGSVAYGSGEGCTGREAAGASDTRW